MKFLKLLFNFYINASLHVAIAVCSLLYITAFTFQFSPSLNLLGFVFFGTISGYNFVKYAKAAGLHHRSLADSLKVIQVVSFIALAAAVYCMFHLPLATLAITAIFGLLTFLYAIPLPRRRNLRTQSGIKIFIVAVVWTGITVVVPLQWAREELIALSIPVREEWVAVTQRFLLVVVWMLPFEIRDLNFDAKRLQTLPQKLGIGKTKWVGIIILLGVLGAEGFRYSYANGNDTLAFIHAISMLVVCLISGWLLLQSKEEQTRYFASFWVESIPIIWFGCYYLLLRII